MGKNTRKINPRHNATVCGVLDIINPQDSGLQGLDIVIDPGTFISLLYPNAI